MYGYAGGYGAMGEAPNAVGDRALYNDLVAHGVSPAEAASMASVDPRATTMSQTSAANLVRSGQAVTPATYKKLETARTIKKVFKAGAILAGLGWLYARFKGRG